MPTRNQVLKAIAEIDDKGNNTAEEMRTVLNLLLEHGEENPATSDDGGGGFEMETFKIVQNGLKDDNSGGGLNYSLRGFNGFYGNLTFSLKFRNIDPGNKDFFFDVTEEFLKVMDNLGFKKEKDRLAFTVPIVFSGNQGSIATTLSIGINQNKMLWIQINHGFDNMNGSIEIKTSVSFHNPVNG